MNFTASPRADGIEFRATGPSSWLVPLDGDERTITQEGPQSFIAHIGCMFKCWSFAGALRACVEDMEHQLYLHDRQEALQREQDRRIGGLSPAAFEYVLAAREQELSGLSVNSPGRAYMLRAEIQSMKDSRDRTAASERRARP
jgi:hypothetical protein